MDRTGQYEMRGSAIGRFWSLWLVQRLVGLAGLAMIFMGYKLILDSASGPGAADVEAVTRQAVGGMTLVFCGGVAEVLVLLRWARR